MSLEIEELLKHELDIKYAKSAGGGGSGCISEGSAYETDIGKVFVKRNSREKAKLMFDGEYTSLEALHLSGEVRVPKPIKVIDRQSKGCFLVMEYVDMSKGLSKYSQELGRQLAKLHLKNEQLKELADKNSGFVDRKETQKHVEKFGFHTTTCCGYLAQDNAWQNDWLAFYAQKLNQQITMVEEEYGDRQARDLWSQILPRLSKLFKDVDVKPALLHGDLWGGNAAENDDGPVIFDAASFYGHCEYDLAISQMFGGFGRTFFDAYYQVIPKMKGHADRLNLYQLFHYINHWNHFGDGYRGSTISILKSVITALNNG